jgi:hypothetical protein
MVDDIRKILGILAQEVNRREEKRGLMDIDVGERDNDSDNNPRNIKNVKISSKNIFANGNLLRKRIHSKL